MISYLLVEKNILLILINSGENKECISIMFTIQSIMAYGVHDVPPQIMC